jgi:transposase-like protein
MSLNLAYPVVPTTETCPNCKSEMSITQVTPILLVEGVEDVTYRCKGCRSEVKRTFKRHSGAWELVTTPKFLRTSSHEAKKKTQLAASCCEA